MDEWKLITGSGYKLAHVKQKSNDDILTDVIVFICLVGDAVLHVDVVVGPF